MQIEDVKKANKILEEIEKHEEAIKYLLKEPRIYWSCVEVDILPSVYYEEMYFEDWEIRLIIHQKKQRIEALKKELEAMG